MYRHRSLLAFLLIASVAGSLTAVQHVYVMDACPATNSVCDELPSEFQMDGVYHFKPDAANPDEVWCDMSGGRWNVMMRRGADGNGTPVTATEQLDFSSMPTAPQETFGSLESEFFTSITPRWSTFDMMVELETNDQTRYFSIFKQTSYDATSFLTVGTYAYGTGGDGSARRLTGATLNTQCSPAGFYTDCADKDDPSRPHLTLPLDVADGARWPTIDKPISKISLKFRPPNNVYCMDTRLAFSPSLLDRADVELHPGLNSADRGGLTRTVGITCKDTSKIILSNVNQGQASPPSRISMTCETNGLSEHPLSEDAICMDNCDDPYKLVVPSQWTLSAVTPFTVDRITCVSQVHNDPGLGPYEAAKRCGDRGEQLLDFPVPADKLETLEESAGIITAMRFSASEDSDTKTAFDLRGNDLKYPMPPGFGDGDSSGRCVGLFKKASAANGVEIKPVSCFDPELRYACHKSPGCGKGQFFWRGFCYQYMPPAPVADHNSTCWQPPSTVGRLSGMPAVSDQLTQSVFQPSPSVSQFVVGVYKRQDGFIRGQDLVPADQLGPAIDADGDCGVFDVASNQLRAVACDSDDSYPVLCQFPGLPPHECFQRSSSVGDQTPDDSLDPSSRGRRATYSCPAGKNFVARPGPHTVEFECQGLRLDWELVTSLDAVDTGSLTYVSPRPQCVVACDMEDMSTAPAGANITVNGIDRYSGCPDGLMMSDSRSEGHQSCDHDARQLQPATMPACDRCVEHPFNPDADFTAVREWDLTPKALGEQVQFRCLEGLVTPAGDAIQNQTCALPTWEGEVVECSTCVWPPEFDHPLISVNSSEPGFGQLVEMECSPGLQAADNSTRSSAVCTPEGWQRCHDSFNCSYCSGEPSDLGALMFIDGNWDGESRYMGFTINYTCQENMTTPEGDTEQVQNCTENGWSGGVMSCSECQGTPLELDEPGITREWSGNTTVGHAAVYRCNEGLSTASGLTEQRQVCGFGWHGDIQPCDSCTGNPPDITDMLTISHNWTTYSWSLGTIVAYTCRQGLVTQTGQREQLVSCGLAGWEGDLLPCDTCETPQAANHTSISEMDTTLLGAGRLGSSVDYRCQPGLSTEDGQDHIRSICLPDGWNRCETDIQCNYCAPLPELLTWGGTLSWDYNGTNVLRSVVTLTCEPGLATLDLATEQTLVCDAGGWNHTAAQPCSVCTEPPPSPPSNMQPNVTWALGGLTATYTCLEQKVLPWLQTTYELTCSPTGWNCVPECDWCAEPPPPPDGAYILNYNGNPNATAPYTCQTNRTTVDQRTVQELTCGRTHWEGVLKPCNSCLGSLAEPSLSQNRTWSGNNTLYEVATYDCYEGMETRSGLTNQTQSCLPNGWTEPPEPCDLCVQPPEVTTGMVRDWDGNRTVNSSITYTCEGNMTTMSNISVQVLNCTENGWWPPLETCAECRMDIPYAGNGSEARNVSWDGGRYPGSTVQYTCQNGLVQRAVCRDGAWQPRELPECILPTQLPPGEITFPPLPPFDPRYPATTNYYWGTIEKDMEENAAGGAFTTGNGPLGFDTSLKLDGTGCMSQQNWAHVNDPCAKNPADCEEGFSFSLWVRLELEDVASMFEEDGTEAPQGPKRYLLSTGGDDSGHPGVAIYLQSHSLSALVSTGDQYWLSSVTGLVRNNTWNNIGVRWSKEGSDGMEAGGLQLLINNSTEGYTVVPEASKEAAKSGLNPGEVMVGCHRTAGNMAYRHKTAAEFDEVAMWTRPLADNETLFFLGGFDSDDKDLDMEKLRIMFKKCVQCRENPVQFKAFISKALVSAKTAPEPASPTVPSTASAEGQAGAGQQPEAAVNLPPDVEQAPPEKVEKIKSLAMLMYDLTDSCKSPMGQDELKDFLEIGALLDETMEMKTLSQWRTVEYSSKEDGGAATVVTRLEKWALDCSSHMVMQPKDRVFVDKQLNNMEMQVEKMKTFNFQEIPIITYPRGKDRRELNTVSFTPELFEQDQECRFVDMSTMFMRYDTYGRISPKRASLIEMDTSDEEMLEVDGQVLSMQVKLNGDLDGTDAYKVANCTPSEERLRTYPVLLTIGHSSPRKALRKPLFHQDEINTGILRRVCVWWNPELSDYGSWDADGCTAIESNEYFTKCRCAHFGQYAIMIEKVPPKVVEIEYQWLQIIKYVCYTISALLLLIFIIAVAKIKQLHEMFHLMRLQTALGLLVGSVFMCMTDIPEIRDSRHACVAFGAIIQVFYLVASMMVMMEGLADFLSMTTGAIGGKLKSYTAISWGVPPLSLGYAFLMYLHDYGTDPRCMLGWPDNVKLTMFVPMMVAMTATAILTALVTCNMQASKLRKENIVAEQLTVCKGYVFFAFFFVVTWVVGVLAYLQLGLQIPSFYPLFQILNSTNGIVFFLFCGVGSERFRLLLTGKAALRRKMLLSYTVSEQLPPAQQPQEEPPRPPTPPEAAPYDPEARAPRKPLVA